MNEERERGGTRAAAAKFDIGTQCEGGVTTRRNSLWSSPARLISKVWREWWLSLAAAAAAVPSPLSSSVSSADRLNTTSQTRRIYSIADANRLELIVTDAASSHTRSCSGDRVRACVHYDSLSSFTLFNAIDDPAPSMDPLTRHSRSQITVQIGMPDCYYSLDSKQWKCRIISKVIQ